MIKLSVLEVGLLVLSYREAMHNIALGIISPVYLLFGEEEYHQEKLIAALRSALLTDILPDFNDSKEDGSQLTGAQVADMANQLPFMAPRRLLLVEQPGFFPYTSKQGKAKEEDEAEADSPEQEEIQAKKTGNSRQAKGKKDGKIMEQVLLDYLEKPAETTCLIFWCRQNRPDRRSKLVAAIEQLGGLVETPRLKAGDVLGELRHMAQASGKSFGPGALEYLARNSQPDLRILASELEKCLTYAGDETTVSLDMIQAVMTPSLEADVFSMVDFMGKKQGALAIRQLRGLLTRGEPALRILFMIARQYRLIFRAKVYLNKGYQKPQIVQALNCHPFVAEKAMQQSRNFTFRELEKAMEILLEKDLALKSGASPRQALEGLILELEIKA
jgi:DNA polymerase-3 subunit delta